MYVYVCKYIPYVGMYIYTMYYSTCSRHSCEQKIVFVLFMNACAKRKTIKGQCQATFLKQQQQQYTT